MAKEKLAHLLLSNKEQFAQNPLLLYRADAPIQEGPRGTWKLEAGITYDFTCYFNAFSVAKYREYTVARAFFLEIEAKGGSFVYTQTRADKYAQKPALVKESEHTFQASRTYKTHEIKLVESPGDVLLGFTITPKEDLILKRATYLAEVDSKDISKVQLALCTTTFKKEAYVTKNIAHIREEILAKPEFSKNFIMHVVDNGRTLNAEELSHDGVVVHPNPNVGGSGGFARGMMEALKQTPKATHVLLMDDDVVVNPESIKRTYYLLRLVNNKYKEAFLSGGMMHINQPNYFFEDAGFVHQEGFFCAAKPQLHMELFHSLIRAETMPIPQPYTQKEDTHENYAAWWYCVIPTSVIEAHGLPLPFFVRSDDVEYSRRVNPLIMTLNGIVVWHEAFDARYAPAQERYQMPRNILIMRSMSPGKVTGDFLGHIKRQFFLELRKFNYTDAELILEGVEDYLKGPEWFTTPGMVEKRFMDALKHSEKLVPIEELRETCAELGVDIDDINEAYLVEEPPLGFKESLELKLSDNGYKFKLHPSDGNPVDVIDSFGFRYPKYRIFGKEVLICVDPKNALASIRTKDKEAYKQLVKRFEADMKTYHRERARLDAEYREAFKHVVTEDFWTEYLGL